MDPGPRRPRARWRAGRTAPLRHARRLVAWRSRPGACRRPTPPTLVQRLLQPPRAQLDPAVLEALRVPPAALPTIGDSSSVLGRVDVAGLPSSPCGDHRVTSRRDDGTARLEPGEWRSPTAPRRCRPERRAGAALVEARGLSTRPLAARRRAELLPRGHGDHRGRCTRGCATGSHPREREESAALAASVPDAGGAWAIPAFQGLGTPYMEAGARACWGPLARQPPRARGTRHARGDRVALPGGLRGAARRLAARCTGRAARRTAVPPDDVLLQPRPTRWASGRAPTVIEAAALRRRIPGGPRDGVWRTAAELHQRGIATASSSDDVPAAREERLRRWQRHVAAAREA